MHSMCGDTLFGTGHLMSDKGITMFISLSRPAGYHIRMIAIRISRRVSWALSYYSDLTLSQEFQPMAAQLSMKASLPLAKILATAWCRSSKTGPRYSLHHQMQAFLQNYKPGIVGFSTIGVLLLWYTLPMEMGNIELMVKLSITDVWFRQFTPITQWSGAWG